MDDLKVCNRIYSILHMHHIRILKGSADMEDAIHSRYVGQEGIPQALSFCCAPAAQSTCQLPPQSFRGCLGQHLGMPLPVSHMTGASFCSRCALANSNCILASGMWHSG